MWAYRKEIVEDLSEKVGKKMRDTAYSIKKAKEQSERRLPGRQREQR